MKLLGFFLTLSGGGLAYASVLLLKSVPAITAFLLAALAVELLGVGLMAKMYIPSRRRP